jgi:hypothetical protein
MKKTPFIVILLGILAFSLIQSCTSDRKQPTIDTSKETVDTVKKPDKKIYVPKETVTIYLAAFKQIGENGDTTYHLALFDANGDFAVDNLTTIFLPEQNIPGHIKWKKVHNGGIKRITEIRYAGEGDPIIFRNGLNRLAEDEWNLDVPLDIAKYLGDSGVTEKYVITFIPEEGNVPVPIDPYLRVPPQP